MILFFILCNYYNNVIFNDFLYKSLNYKYVKDFNFKNLKEEIDIFYCKYDLLLYTEIIVSLNKI